MLQRGFVLGIIIFVLIIRGSLRPKLRTLYSSEWGSDEIRGCDTPGGVVTAGEVGNSYGASQTMINDEEELLWQIKKFVFV